ncbi:hypothetical protein EOD39_16101, partial [Acipenser ruthenus]
LEFLRLLDSLDYILHVKGATHNHGHTLDLVISCGLAVKNIITLDLTISDHLAILFEVNLPASTKTVDHTFKSQVINSTAAKLSDDSLPLSESPSVDELVNTYNTTLTGILDTVAPIKTLRVSFKKSSPWFSDTTHKMKYEGRELERRGRESKLRVHYITWKEHLGQYGTALVLARSSYYYDLTETNKNNPRFLFATLDKLINPSPNSPTLDIGASHSCNDF